MFSRHVSHFIMFTVFIRKKLTSKISSGAKIIGTTLLGDSEQGSFSNLYNDSFDEVGEGEFVHAFEVEGKDISR